MYSTFVIKCKECGNGLKCTVECGCHEAEIIVQPCEQCTHKGSEVQKLKEDIRELLDA